MPVTRTLTHLNWLFAALTCVLLGVAGHRTLYPQRPNLGQDRKAPVYYFNFDFLEISDSFKTGADKLLAYLQSGDRAALTAARSAYAKAVNEEDVGTPSSALLWLCDYFLATDDERRSKLRNPEGARLLSYLSSQGYTPLQSALDAFKGGNKPITPDGYLTYRLLLDSNPTRDTWEQSDRLLRACKLQPGASVADLGAGPGYFTVRLAQAVGPTGHVIALDNNPPLLQYIALLARREGLHNVTVGIEQPLSLPPASLDCVFSCSHFHLCYGMWEPAKRDALIEGLRQALKPRGTLVVCDNEPVVTSGGRPYIDDRISRYVVSALLESSGFRLRRCYEVNPARYALIFERLP